MPNIRFITDNIVDVATLDATNSTNTKYSEDNITKISRSRVFRSDDTTETDIKGVYSVGADINALVIGRHNFSDSVTYRLILYPNDDYTGTPYDTGTVQVTSEQAASDLYEWGEFRWGTVTWGADKLEEDNRQFYNIVVWLPQTFTTKSFILRLSAAGGGAGGDPLYCNNFTITCNDSSITCNQTTTGEGGDPGSAGIDYYEVGRLYLGEYIEPTYNLSYGHGMSWSENTSQYRPSSGTLQSDIVTRNKRFEFSLNMIPEADRISLHKDLSVIGLEKDFFISIFPEQTTYTDKEEDYQAIVKFVRIPKYTEFFHSYYRSNFVVEEA